MKNIINNAVINIKIEIKVNEYLREFIFKNINMRRIIWNDFVEEANKYKNDYNNYIGFNPMEFKTKYFEYETLEDRYEEYCVGLSEQVAKDVKRSLKIIHTKNEKVFNGESTSKLGSLKFHKRNNYYGSFKVHTKNALRKSGKIKGRLKVLDNKLLNFRVRGGYYDNKEFLDLELLENLYDYYDDVTDEYVRYYNDHDTKNECRFMLTDIKEIAFIHDLGKFYIQLAITAKYHINKSEIASRIYDIAGIDTGIHNPFMIYDGNAFINIRMNQKICNKIHYLERKAKRLNHFMSKKYEYNISHNLNPYSKNYEKVKMKFRKIHRKITNIKRHWSYNICKWIVTRYKIIVVDRFNFPNANDTVMLRCIQKKFNYYNLFHRMYITNEILVHMSNKYGCKYVEAPKNTTCTCSECGHKNPHLPLNIRKFKCEKCGFTIDRDENAAKNCYAFA